MKFTLKSSVILLALVLLITLCAGCRDTGSVMQGESLPTAVIEQRTPPVIEKAEEVEPTAGKFTVSRVFSDNMVLQRNEYLRIWGWANNQDGKIICAEFMGLKGSAVIEDGSWLITLDGTLKESTAQGNTLRVYSQSHEKKYENVLVGDVYMVIGQSNTAYVVNNYLVDAAKDPAYNKSFTAKDITNNDNIRIFRNVMGDPMTGGDVTSKLSKNPNSRGWQMPEETGLLTSAIGYFFAKQITQKTNNEIPIGLIEISAAGCVMAAYMPAEVAEECGVDAYSKTQNGFYADSAIGLQKSRIVYNQYIHPFMNFTISGLLWYQGESDGIAGLQENYPENFTKLMTYYRDTINQNYHDFPIFISEFPSIYPQPADFKGGTWHYMELGGIRSYLGLIPSQLKNSFIAASSDVWSNKDHANNLHPYCKWPMAERITNMAMPLLYADYTDTKIDDAAGPVLETAKLNSKTSVDLQFVHVGTGLKTANGSKPEGVEVLVSTVWVPAETVSLSGNKMTVKHDSAFSAIRYNGNSTDFYPDTVNICNGAGVPLCAFYCDLASYA